MIPVSGIIILNQQDTPAIEHIHFHIYEVCPKRSWTGFKMIKRNPSDLWINHICKVEQLLNLYWKFHAIRMSISEDMHTYISVE